VFNLKKLLCIASVCFIAVPIPAFAVETQVDEPFDENGFTQSTISVTNWSLSNDTTTSYEINNTWAGDYGSTGYSINYNINSVSNRMLQITFSENDITEIGFKVGAVNYEWHYNVFIKDADGNSSNPDWVTYSIASGYQDFDESYTAPEGYTIWRIEMNFSDYVLVDDLYYVYDDGTTATTTTTSTTSSTTTSTTTTSTTTTSSTTTTTTTTIPKTQDELEIEKNYAETGLYETNDERAEREAKEKAEREAREEAIRIEKEKAEQEYKDGLERDRQRDKNFEETGIRETDAQRQEREELEAKLKAEEEERLRLEEERLIQEEKDKNFAETGIYELDSEREARELKEYEEELARIEAEKEAEIQRELEESIDLEELDLPEEEVKELIDTIQEIEEQNLEEVYVIEEEVIDVEIPEEIIIIIEEEVVEPIKEDIVEEIIEDDIDRDVVVENTTEVAIEEVQEVIENIKEVEVNELETDEVIEVLTEVVDVGVENLDLVSEDVLEVIEEVVEQVIEIAQEEELTEEQIEVVAEVFNFEEKEDVEVLAEAVKTDSTVAKAVDEFVERAIENKDVEDYTLADVQTEIAFESLVSGDFSVIIDVELDAINLANISNDMTQDTKEKAQEVILPTVIVNIVSFVRRFS
jgi:hypothetical protein